MIIRKCNLEDLNKVTDLFDQYRVFYGQKSDTTSAIRFIEERLSAEDSVIFLAFDEKNNPAGFTQLYPSFSSVGMKKIWILNDLFVSKNYRRQGVAKLLMAKAVSHTIQTGRSKLVLETGENNLEAQQLYESLGWTKEKTLNYEFSV